MARNSSLFNSNEKSPDDSNQSPSEEKKSTRANAKIVPAGDPLLMGYILEPAQIIVTHIFPPGVSVVGDVKSDVKEVKFICPEIDIAPLFLEMKELKEILKEIFDTKQLSQEIGNELVGETYLRWDTQVRFYPTIVFIFLQSEENFLKRSILDKSQYKKKIQIKLRITKHSIEEFNNNKEFLKNYVIDLKSKVLKSIDTYKFISGNVRCTYVNQGTVSWKTTIFAKEKKEAALILIRLCDLIGEIVNPKFLTSGDVRLANQQESNIPVDLYKVSLLINKKKEQIIIYHV